MRPAVPFVLVALCLSAVLWAQSRLERGSTGAVSARLVELYTQRFGGSAPKRIEAWKRFAERSRAAAMPELELLAEVNRVLNRVQFVDDLRHWGELDYWATPAESVASNGADCEDFSIAK